MLITLNLPELAAAISAARSMMALLETLPERISASSFTEAGWTPGPAGIRQKDGKPLGATCFVFTELHERIVTPVQATLRDAGFDMQIKRLESAAFNTATRAGEHDMRFLPMIYSSADFLYFFVSQAIPSLLPSFTSRPVTI